MTIDKSRFRIFFANWISIIGLLIVCFGTLLGTVLMIVDVSGGMHNPYAGLIIYMGIPAFVLLGVGLMLLGAFLTIRKRRKIGHETPLPAVDFNDPKVLRRFIISCVLALAFITATGMGGYHAFHFTESVEFCGEICHEVMEPEYVAYQNSPHANVSCAHCHIGPGAEWFVKAKLSGLYQVYSVLFDKYHRPIETPIHNLRPAKETCNECHWPRKFFGSVLRSWTYYLPNETSEPWTIKMLMKVGGGDPAYGPVGGIHWHINEDVEIDYVSMDGKREEIPWIRVKGRDGKVTIYEDKKNKLSEEELSAMHKRRMDCIDCHNRPTHRIMSPNKVMDTAMTRGLIDEKFTDIRIIGMDLLVEEYKTQAEAFKAIDEGLRDEYEGEDGLEGLIAQIKTIYRNNFFPEMKVDWRSYPDHIGHKITAGCFRCHDDKHVSKDGKKISRDCNLCHTIIAQGPGEAKDVHQISSGGLEFKHPEDIDGEWKEGKCDECHEGVPM